MHSLMNRTTKSRSDIRKSSMPAPIKKSSSNRGKSSNDRSSVVSERSIPQRKTNIQVYLRCKGGIQIDNKRSIPTVEPVESSPNTDILLCSNNTSYCFDRVFYQYIQQEDIYNEVAKPMLYDVLEGLSCTIFAYGQTGTGKTYTMEGDLEENHVNAGIIPRSIYNIFEIIKERKLNCIVKVSMLELYNENLKDLLSYQEKDVKIFEDKERLGMTVQNLGEIIVQTPQEALYYMKSGVRKRMTAYTKCNDKSSRSHCIFTIILYICDNDKDIIKVGKLNLVDLAGSENSRNSGSEHIRAREAANINKSLLTLGRVINSLVDNATHIPYRESKLTRLLKDSLGGYTKTCIIATISPTEQKLEEIRNTLEYGSHAKGILNYCQDKQRKIDPYTVIESLTQENHQLRTDLNIQYECKGVYRKKEDDDRLLQEINQSKESVVAAHKKITEKDVEIQDLKRKCKEIESKWKEAELKYKQTQSNLRSMEREKTELEAAMHYKESKYTKLKMNRNQLEARLTRIEFTLSPLKSACESALDLCKIETTLDSEGEESESPGRLIKKPRFASSPNR